MRVACLLFHSPQDTQTLGEILYRLTPQIMLRGKEAIFLEVSSCHRLYSENAFQRSVTAILKRLDLSGRLVIADSVPSSLAQARYAQKELARLPLEALESYLDPLGEHPDQTAALDHMILSLKELGIRNLQELTRIPAAEIASRFSTLGLLALDRVKEQSPLAWRRFLPREKVTEKHAFDLERPAENLEPVYFVLKTLLDRVFLRLRGRGRRARRFDVVLRQEGRGTQRDLKILILLQLPWLTPKSIFQITREKIDAQVQLSPIKERISEVFVQVTEEVPYFALQKDIFNPAKEENDETFFGLVSRMALKLSENRVFFAIPKENYLPEKNWVRHPGHLPFKPTEPSEVSLAQRPLRLYPDPIPIQIQGETALTPEGSCRLDVSNVEILWAEWWEDPVERTYRKAFAPSGKVFWVFESRKGSFLHGEFD